jgi:hypothetical protein
MNRFLSTIPVVAEPTPILACPRCGRTNTHPTSVRCNPAGSLPGEVVIEDNGILWNPAVAPDGRGVRIELVFGARQVIPSASCSTSTRAAPTWPGRANPTTRHGKPSGAIEPRAITELS